MDSNQYAVLVCFLSFFPGVNLDFRFPCIRLVLPATKVRVSICFCANKRIPVTNALACGWENNCKKFEKNHHRSTMVETFIKRPLTDRSGRSARSALRRRVKSIVIVASAETSSRRAVDKSTSRLKCNSERRFLTTRLQNVSLMCLHTGG